MFPSLTVDKWTFFLLFLDHSKANFENLDGFYAKTEFQPITGFSKVGGHLQWHPEPSDHGQDGTMVVVFLGKVQAVR